MKKSLILGFLVVAGMGVGSIALILPVHGTPIKESTYVQTLRKELRHNRKDLKETVENRDYTGWKEIITKKSRISKRAPLILQRIDTEEKFQRLCDAFEAMVDGNREEAKEILKSLGIERPNKKQLFGQ